MTDLPRLALSVRQPWAWAIVAGHKPIENRSAASIRAGRMGLGPVAIHAAAGLKEAEFQWGAWRLALHGVTCPRPETLARSAIIGVVDVVAIVDQSDSEWFGGDHGLVLENARAVDPIPAKGALGYFEWVESGELAKPMAWMQRFDMLSAEPAQLGLFEDLEMSFAETPQRPRRKG